MINFFKGLAKSVLKDVVYTVGSEIQNSILPNQIYTASNENQFSVMRKILQEIQNNTIYFKNQAPTSIDSESRKKYEYNLWLLKDFAADVNKTISEIESL